MKRPNEIHLIQQIRKLSARTSHAAVLQSIGDDCAIVRPPPGRDMVFTTDFVLEDRHFTLDTHKPSEIGHKALARSLSDLAAMGAKPLFCLVSLAIPPRISATFVPRFYKGLLALAARHTITLAGGDLSSFPQVVADVMCCGTVAKGKALLRSAAKPGDFIYVTGALGTSGAGLRIRRGAAWKSHRLPTPRIEPGLELSRLGVKCAMDLSDGLSLDLARLCTESNTGAELFSPLPVSRLATLDDALNGGEDYELLFTAPPRLKVPNQIAGVAATRIGCITVRQKTITLDGRLLPMKGFDHFA